MPAAPRHAKPRKPVTRRGAPVVAAATLAGVAAAFVFMHGGSAAARPSHGAMPVTSAASGFTNDYAPADASRTIIARRILASARAAQRRHLAKLAAARRARRRAARQQAAAQPSPAPTAAPAPSSSGGDYQFALGTWEKYGGAASEYGVAGPAYQDQIFDNAIAAGGASNWTSYDGC